MNIEELNRVSEITQKRGDNLLFALIGISFLGAITLTIVNLI